MWRVVEREVEHHAYQLSWTIWPWSLARSDEKDVFGCIMVLCSLGGFFIGVEGFESSSSLSLFDWGWGTLGEDWVVDLEGVLSDFSSNLDLIEISLWWMVSICYGLRDNVSIIWFTDSSLIPCFLIRILSFLVLSWNKFSWMPSWCNWIR